MNGAEQVSHDNAQNNRHGRRRVGHGGINQLKSRLDDPCSSRPKRQQQDGVKGPDRSPSSNEGNLPSPDCRCTGATAGRNNGMEGSLGREYDTGEHSDVSSCPYRRNSRSVSGTRQNPRGNVQRSPEGRQKQQEIILRELDDDDEEYVDDKAGESTQEDAPPAQGDDQVILCGLYWDSNKRLDLPEEFVKLLEYAQNKNIPVLICRDFNAHSEVWGSHTPNARGRIMEEVMITHDLCVLNEGDRPTWKHENTKGTIIDVCLASSVLMKRFDGWKVSNYATASDHRRIDFKFCKNEQNIRIGRNLRKANWLLFQGEISTYLANVPDIPEKWDTNTVDGQVDLLESAIMHGLDKVAPLKPRRLRDKSPINDPRVIEAEKEFHRMRGRVKRKGRTDELLEQFRNAKRNKKKAWKDATRDGYRGYVNEIADAKGAAQLMRSVKRDSFVPPTLLKNNGKYTSTKKETIEVLMDTHFPGSLQAQLELASQMEDIVRGDNAAKKLPSIKWINEEGDKVFL